MMNKKDVKALKKAYVAMSEKEILDGLFANDDYVWDVVSAGMGYYDEEEGEKND